MGSDIFLSYSRADGDLAKKFVEAASGRGIDVWFDEKIQGGDDWRQKIVEALGSAKALVILFSEHSNESTELIKELAIADKMRKRVVPVLIADTEPKGAYLYEMASRNWINICPNPETRLDRLVDTLATQLGLRGANSSTSASIATVTNPPRANDISSPVEALARSAATDAKDERLSAFGPPLARKVAHNGSPYDGKHADWLPIKRSDVYFLGPILAASIAMILSPSIGWNRSILAIGALLSPSAFALFMIVISVRNARLNRDVFSKESFASYLAVGLVGLLPSIIAVALDPELPAGDGRISIIIVFITFLLPLAAFANVLQVILRKTFMRNSFRSRTARPLPS